MIKQQNHGVTMNMKNHFHIHEVTSCLLQNKNLKTIDQVEAYIASKNKALDDPYCLTNMDQGVKLIAEAVAQQKKILVYGDYDADGVTSTAQLVLILKQIQAKYAYYSPDRETDGYGLHEDKVSWMIENGYQVLVTLDCGISNEKEVAKAIEAGIQVVIIDHHKPAQDLPPAHVIINPHVYEQDAFYQNLCGAGLTLFFVRALSQYLEIAIDDDLYYQLAAIGTVADIVPITDQNQLIVKKGLEAINTRPIVGVDKLIRQLYPQKQPIITAETIAYTLAPRINAAGRMTQAVIALRLLLSQDPKEAYELSEILLDLNNQRKIIEKQIFDEALKKIASQKEDKVIIVEGDDWHEGVIGIVSSRITERFFKPSIVFAKTGDYYKGSGRSIPGFNIYQGIKALDHLTIKAGGHPQAVGLTVHQEQFPEFKETLKQNTDFELKPIDMVKNITIDCIISQEERIDQGLVEEIKTFFEPFGFKNEKPYFLIRDYEVLESRYLGQDENHLKATIKIGQSIFDAICFNITPEDKKEFLNHNPLVGQLELNHFNGKTTVQFQIYDFTGHYFQDLKLQAIQWVMDHQYHQDMIGEPLYVKESPVFTEDEVIALEKDTLEDLDALVLDKLAYLLTYWVPDLDTEEIILQELSKNKGKIFKFQILKLVNYINRIYNISINEEMILYTVIKMQREEQIKFQYKNNTVYIKYLA